MIISLDRTFDAILCNKHIWQYICIIGKVFKNIKPPSLVITALESIAEKSQKSVEQIFNDEISRFYLSIQIPSSDELTPTENCIKLIRNLLGLFLIEGHKEFINSENTKNMFSFIRKLYNSEIIHSVLEYIDKEAAFLYGSYPHIYSLNCLEYVQAYSFIRGLLMLIQ